MTRIAVIGHTGLVGQNVLKQFQDMKLESDEIVCFNSSNIEDIVGQGFDHIINAGLSGTKWQVNADPDADRERINRLKKCLLQVSKCGYMTHLSSVDVFSYPLYVNELDDPQRYDLHDYGKNRLDFENWVGVYFPNSTIIRLPGLFGDGLTKNPIYDLIHDHRVEHIAADAVYQWFDLDDILKEIFNSTTYKIRHLVTPPISMYDLTEQVFPEHLEKLGSGNLPKYNVMSVDDYVMDLDQIIDRIKNFKERTKRQNWEQT